MNDLISALVDELKAIEGNTTKVIVSDGPIAEIKTSTCSLAFPLASYRFGDFDDIVKEAAKATIVYIWKIEKDIVRDPQTFNDHTWYLVRFAMVYA